jgi:hypothetical protein
LADTVLFSRLSEVNIHWFVRQGGRSNVPDMEKSLFSEPVTVPSVQSTSPLRVAGPATPWLVCVRSASQLPVTVPTPGSCPDQVPAQTPETFIGGGEGASLLLVLLAPAGVSLGAQAQTANPMASEARALLNRIVFRAVLIAQ